MVAHSLPGRFPDGLSAILPVPGVPRRPFPGVFAGGGAGIAVASQYQGRGRTPPAGDHGPGSDGTHRQDDRRGPGLRRRKESPSPSPADLDAAGTWNDSLEDAFELLLTDPAAVQAAAVRHITAEEIRWQRCSYCDRPARSSIFDLTQRVRVLLCDACRPCAGRSSTPAA